MNGQRSRSGSSTKFLTGGQTKVYMRLPKVSGFKSVRKKDEAQATVSFDFILKNFDENTTVEIEKISKLFGNTRLKKIKVIAGKDKIEKRKFGKDIILSKSINNICDLA